MDKKAALVSGAIVSGLAGLVGGGLLLYRWWRRKGGEENPYETAKSVNEYMGFHYASPYEYVSFSFAPKDALDFPLRCAELCQKNKSVRFSVMSVNLVCIIDLVI